MAEEDLLFEEFEAIADDSARSTAQLQNLICYRFGARGRFFFFIVASVRAYLDGACGLKSMVRCNVTVVVVTSSYSSMYFFCTLQ